MTKNSKTTLITKDENRIIEISLLIFTLLITLTTSFLYLDIYQQAVLAYTLMVVTYILTKIKSENQLLRFLILSFGSYLTLRYWIFRTFHTLGYTGFFDSIAMAALYLAESYAIVIYFLGIFVNISPIKREPPTLPEDKNLLPTVDVFIPTYNEPIDIIRITLIACKQLHYPEEKLNIYILDDGGTWQKRNDPDPEKREKACKRYEELKNLAKELEINYITRAKNEHAKAGNLNHALWLTSEGYEKSEFNNSEWYCFGKRPQKGGDLILVLDCDHVPTTDFLENTVGFFLKDPKLFLVQTPHFFINPTPIEKNLRTYAEAPGENEMFYGEIHRGLDFWNSSFFCGSGAILRRKYLEEAGGFKGDTITEDAETSLTLHSMGYNSVYLRKPMICGLSPETFDDFITQRSRWTQGMIQILMLKNPLKQKGLKWYQKLCYTNNCIFWFFGVARVIFILAPLLYLLFGARVYNVSIEQIISYAIPHLFTSFNISNYLYGKVRHPFFSEIFETAQSFLLLFPALGAAFAPKKPVFKVTPKGVSLTEDYINKKAFFFYFLLILCIVGIYAGAIKWLYSPLERGAVAVCVSWNLFNITMIIASIGALYELRQIRRFHRIETEEEALVIVPGQLKSYKAKIIDISLGGVAFRTEEKIYIPVLGSKIEVVTWACKGEEFRFSGIIRRVTTKENTKIIGLSFDSSNSEESIVKYVYGDSSRWERFWIRREKEKGILSGFSYLISIGFASLRRSIRASLNYLLKQIKDKNHIKLEVPWKSLRALKKFY